MSPRRTNLIEPVGKHIAKVETILRANWPVGEAIASLRGKSLKQSVIYFYVLDTDDTLLLMCADVLTTTVYLGLATWMLM